MQTITGKIESATGEALHRRITFESKSTPQASAAGLVTTNTTYALLSNAETGEFSVQLRPGRYAVTYETKPKATSFNIEVVNSSGSVSIDELIVDSFATLPDQAPYLVWNGERAGHITFEPIDAPPAPGLAVVAGGGHIGALEASPGAYEYVVTYVTLEGETEASATATHLDPAGAATNQIRITLEVGPTRVVTKRIYRFESGNFYLLAEVAPNVATYDDWESHADFQARIDGTQPPSFNTTAGIIYSSPGVACLYFSSTGLRALASMQCDAGVYVVTQLYLGAQLGQDEQYAYFDGATLHFVGTGPVDKQIFTASVALGGGTPSSFTILADQLYFLAGATAGYVLTSDANGKATWQSTASAPSSSVITATANPNGVVTQTGPAICIGTGAADGLMWKKTSAGTDNVWTAF